MLGELFSLFFLKSKVRLKNKMFVQNKWTGNIKSSLLIYKNILNVEFNFISVLIFKKNDELMKKIKVCYLLYPCACVCVCNTLTSLKRWLYINGHIDHFYVVSYSGYGAAYLCAVELSLDLVKINKLCYVKFDK